MDEVIQWKLVCPIQFTPGVVHSRGHELFQVISQLFSIQELFLKPYYPGFALDCDQFNLNFLLTEKGPFLLDKLFCFYPLQLRFYELSRFWDAHLNHFTVTGIFLFLKVDKFLFGQDALFWMEVLGLTYHLVDPSLCDCLAFEWKFVFLTDGKGFELELSWDLCDGGFGWGFWGFFGFWYFPLVNVWSADGFGHPGLRRLVGWGKSGF